MIHVNLLPPELETPKTPFNPAYPIGVVAAVVFIGLFWVYRKQINVREAQRLEITKANNEIKQLEPIIAQVEQLETAKAQLTQKKGIIQSLENERLRYPQFMDDLVRLLPTNIWLTNLTTIPQANGAAMDVTLGLAALDNYAIADLVSNLESSQIFTDIDLSQITTTAQAQGGQSMTFQIKTVYKNAGGTNADKKS
jgi:type IV pilus assembly protein PilN